MKSVFGDICVLFFLRNEYFYFGNDFLDIFWNISDVESQIEDVFVGIGFLIFFVVFFDVFGYIRIYYNVFYCFRYFGLVGSSIVFFFVKVVNKVSKEIVMLVGLVIIDEILFLCINKFIIELVNGLVVVFWFFDDFEDNE